MSSFSYTFGITAGAIRNDLINVQYGPNYAGDLISYSILGQYSDGATVPIGVYNFAMTYEFDNINGTISVAAAGDTTPPTISGSTSISFTQGSITSNGQLLSTYYSASDNVGISAFYVSGTIFYGTAGTYNVTLVAEDTSNNTTTLGITVTINPAADTTPPTITGPSSLLMDTNQYSLSYILNLFTASDPSGVASKVILGSDFSTFNNTTWNSFITQPGTFSLFVRAIDNFGNSRTIGWTLTIQAPLDFTAPTLSLSTTVLQFFKSVYPTEVSPTIITNSMLSVASAADNLDPNPTFEFDRPRTPLNDLNNETFYQIRAVDNSGNKSPYQSITLFYVNDVQPSDTTPPTLSLSTNVFNFNVSQYPSGVTSTQIRTFIGQFITASDNSGTFIIQYNPTVQDITIVPEIGLTDSYSYEVRAVDNSGNASPYVSFTVNYVNNTAPADTTAPIINGSSTQTFLASDNRTLGYLLTLYTITDSTQPVSFYNMDSSFTFNTVGTFPVTLQAIDGVGNIGTKNITVNVVDTTPTPDNTPPTIVGANFVTVYVGDSLNTDAFLNTYYVISDPSGISSKTLIPSVNFGVASTYLTTIYAIDNFGNTSTKAITINILEGANPNIPIEQGNTTLEDIYIEDELMTNKVKLGFTLSDKIDVELDSATLIIPYTTRELPYRPFTKVKFYFKNVGQPLIYYVSDDSVARLSSASAFFQHSLVLIEPTKILERFKCVDMTFTQPIDDAFASYTLLDVVNRVFYNNPTRKATDTETYWDTIEGELSNLLASIKAPQLQFRSMTIREALDRAFQYINAVARLKILENGTRVLSADFFNTLDTMINLESAINISRSQGSEFFAENSELTVENATTEYATVKYPSYGWAGVRSEGALLNSDNFNIQLPFPIYELLSLRLFLRVKIYDGETPNIPISNEYREIDITPYVFEKQLYDALPTGTQARQTNGELHSYNTLYYTRGDNRIYNISTIADLLPLGFLNNQRTIDLILKRIFTDESSIQASWSPVKFSDILFQVEYRTLLSSRLRFMRDVKEDFFGTIHTNQMENIVDLEALGSNARGVINRVGNPELTVSKVVKTWNNRFKIGQFTEDGFIATNVENAVFNDHIRSTASFTKNYNGLSRFVGVETEIRQLSIPLQTTKTILNYGQFIIASRTIKEDITNFATNNLIGEFADYLKQFSDKDITDRFLVDTRVGDFGNLFIVPDGLGVIEVLASGTLGGTTQYPTTLLIIPEPIGQTGPFQPIYSFTTTTTLLWNSELLVGINPQLLNNQQYRVVIQRAANDTSNIRLTIKYKSKYQFDKYMVNFTTFNSQAQQIARVAATPDISSVNNSIKIDWKFDDNLSAGFNIERDIAGTLLTGQRKVLYTNNIGRFDYFQFEVAELKPITGSQDKLDFAARFPSVLNTDFQLAILTSPLMQHKKDNTENFAITYQMHMVVDDAEQNHLVIGKKMLTRWFKGDTTNDITFKLYISNIETYSRFDNEKAKGTMQSGEDAYTITTILTPTTRAIKIDINQNVSNAKSFAIGNANGDLILGVNVENPYTGEVKDMTTIYLNFTDKRS
jgi:hypothetical protein